MLSLSTHNEGVAVVKSECSGRASFPVGKSWDSLFNSDCELSREKQWGGRAEAESLIFLFCSLECLKCLQVGGDCVRHKVLLRAD